MNFARNLSPERIAWGREVLGDPIANLFLAPQIARKTGDVGLGQVGYDALGEHQHLGCSRAHVSEEAPECLPVGEVELDSLQPATRRLFGKPALSDPDHMPIANLPPADINR